MKLTKSAEILHRHKEQNTQDFRPVYFNLFFVTLLNFWVLISYYLNPIQTLIMASCCFSFLCPLHAPLPPSPTPLHPNPTHHYHTPNLNFTHSLPLHPHSGHTSNQKSRDFRSPASLILKLLIQRRLESSRPSPAVQHEE